MSDDLDLSAFLPPETEKPEPKPGPLIPEIVEEEEELPNLPDFDTQPVAVRLIQYQEELNLMLERSRQITVIKDQATNEKATAWALQAKKLNKKLEKLRKHFVDPHNKFLRQVNNFFKKAQEPLTEIEKSLARKVGAFRQLQENERRQQEAAAKKAAEEQQQKLAEEAAESAEQGLAYEPVSVVAPVIPEVAKVTRTAEGSASQTRKWVCRIIDPGQVPREYCEPSQKLLNEAVKGGAREIPGCEIKEEFQTSLRC